MKNIIVGIDFDRNARALIDKASEIAEKFAAKVWIIHVAEPNTGFVESDGIIRSMRAGQLREEHHFLQQLSDSLAAKGILSDALLISGDTAASIIDQAKKLEADLIVIGYNEHNFLYRLFRGTTASTVIRDAGIPVMIIPVK